MKSFFRKIFASAAQVSEKPASQKGLVLSLPVIVALGLFLLCATGWAYFMGFMVGRGHNPETKIQEMTAFLQKDKEAPQNKSDAHPDQENVQPPPEGDSKNSSAPGAVAEPPAVNEPARQAGKNVQQAYPFNRPAESGLAAWEKPGGKKAAPAAKTPDRKKNAIQAQQAGKKSFDYVFQVAAFKTLKDADSMKRKLEKNSLRGNVQKSGKVYLVLVNLRGNENAPVELAGKLKLLKLGKPLLLKKKQVGAKNAKGR